MAANEMDDWGEKRTFILLPVLETSSLAVWNQGDGRAKLPPVALKENLFLVSFTFWWPQGFLDLWLRSLCLHCLFLLGLKTLPASLLYEGMWLHLEPTQLIHDKLLLSKS